MNEDKVTDAPGRVPQRVLLSSRREYLDGMDAIIARAQRELRIFDPDLSELGLGSPARVEALAQFLRRSRNNRIYVALHATEFVVGRAPRVINLLVLFSANMWIHQTQDDAARAQDCFVLGDAEHVVRRPVAKQPRGVLILDDPAEASTMRERFAEIWQSSFSAVSANTAGL